MDSGQAAVSAPFGTNSPEPTASDSDPARAKSLKRGRSDQLPANLSSIANAGLGGAPSPKSPRYKGMFTPGYIPIPLTGEAAMEDRRREEENQRRQQTAMSENPGHKALSSLMAGGGTGMSKPQDAPVATTSMSEGMASAANAISMTSPSRYEDRHDTSPASVTSLASLGSTAQTATANSTIVASPAAMTNTLDSESRDFRAGNNSQQQTPVDEHSNRALSFPGNLLDQLNSTRASSRGLSLPMPSQQLAPRSPSQKKHKCPYCDTEFTRHHNLKSHLLTHSQEKPYVCQTCSMRFRRLHDLKRHTKLHTGERPHICPKCDRKFARGDALARHAKGQGGCAGRRASMGSFGGDDDYEGSNAGDGDDSVMDGVLYTNGSSHQNESEMTEEERRRFSLPSIKAQHVSGSGSGDSYASHSRTPSTYPPAGPRPGTGQPTGGLYPPNVDRGGTSISNSPSMQNSATSGHTPNTSISSMPMSSGGSMFSQSAMTESPKPLSPGGMHSHQLGHDHSINRQRSPSLTTQFQQQQFGRRQSGISSPPIVSPGMSLPSPHGSSHAPKLPGLPGLAPPNQRYTLPSQAQNSQTQANSQGGHLIQSAGHPTSPSAIYQSQSGIVPGRGHQMGSNQQGNASNDNSNNLFASGDRGMWNYVQQLEGQVKQLSEEVQVLKSNERNQEGKISQLSDEVMLLRRQLDAQNQSQQPMLQGHS